MIDRSATNGQSYKFYNMGLPQDTARQLNALGYGLQDRVWFRALLPKQLDLPTAKALGLTWTNKHGVDIKQSYEFYLEAGQLWQKFYNDFKPVSTDTLAKVNDQGFGVYNIVNPGGTTNDAIKAANTLFYECDGISKAEQWAKVKRLEAKLGKQATLIVETANSLHVYFALSAVMTDLAAWKAMQKRLILEQDSDKAIHNPARLMRLAGFKHQKWDASTKSFVANSVKVVQETVEVTALQTFDAVLPHPIVEVRTPNPSGRLDGFNLGMLDLAEYLEGYNPDGRNGWATAKCPAHNGDSFDSLQVNQDSGKWKCHSGCHNSDIWKATVEAAIAFDPSLKDQIYKQTNQYSKTIRQEAIKEVHKLSNGLVKYAPDIVVNQKNFTLPDDGYKGANFVSSAPKTGKTQAASEGIGKHLDDGFQVRSLNHRNGLGLQIAVRANLKHIQEMKQDITAINAEPGLSLCVDSLPWLQVKDVKDNTFIFIDECNAVAEHFIEGGTLKEAHEGTLEHAKKYLHEVAAKGGTFLFMEHNLTDRCIEFWRYMIGMDVPSRLIVNTAVTSHWNIELAGGSRGEYTNRMQQDLGADKPFVLVVDAQRYGEQFERAVRDEEKASGTKTPKKILRVDKKTGDLANVQHFKKNPDEHLAQNKYDAIILSPTVESGLSFWTEGYETVYGLFSHSTSRKAVQMLERYRLNVPRVIFCPDRAVGSSQPIDAEALLKQWQADADDMKGRVNVRERLIADAHEINEDPHWYEPYRNLTDEAANDDGKFFNDLASRFKAAELADKSNLKQNLIDSLTAMGHNLTLREKWKGDKVVTEGLKAAQKGIEEDYTAGLIEADGAKRTPDQARQKLKTHECTQIERLECEKTLWLDRLPEYDFTSFENVKYLIEKDGKNFTLASRRLWLEYPELARQKDQAAIARRYNRGSFVMLHTLPKNAQQIDILVKVRFLIYRLKAKGYWSNYDQDAIDLNFLLVTYREQFKRAISSLNFEELRPGGKDENGKVIQAVTVCTNVNKLMRWFGWSTVKQQRLGAADERYYVYAIKTDDEALQADLDASLRLKYADKIAEIAATQAMSPVLLSNMSISKNRGHENDSHSSGTTRSGVKEINQTTYTVAPSKSERILITA